MKEVTIYDDDLYIIISVITKLIDNPNEIEDYEIATLYKMLRELKSKA